MSAILRLQQLPGRLTWNTLRPWLLLSLVLTTALALLRYYGSPVKVPSLTLSRSDWSQYAYASYATNGDSLCNSVMLFESLARLGSKADRVLLHPSDWSGLNMSEDIYAHLLDRMREYNVKLEPIVIQEFHDVDPTWSKGFTKLLAFNQTQYKRVLSLDSDATILQPMDDLFHLPSSPVAMPRAYWLKDELNAQLILFEPSTIELQRIQDAYAARETGKTEMDMLNTLYKETCLVIPHRPYCMITGEFKGKGHERYMGYGESWDPDAAMAEARFIHFSDWPLPKPWQAISAVQWDTTFPQCEAGSDCRDRHAWMSIYIDFLTRREKVCGQAFMPHTGIPSYDI